MGDLLVFGWAAHAASPAAKQRMVEFTILLGKLSGAEVAVCEADTYSELAGLVHRRSVDIAWLAPIPFIALERRKAAAPLVSHHRGGRAQFHSVLIVPARSRIRTPYGLKKKRAAWVDPHSASGYVIPRIQLAAFGIDPRTAFAAERFYGSHEAAVRAVVGGKADFAGTYAQLDRDGAPLRGSWLEVPGAADAVRVLVTFGAVPGDVIVARRDLPAATRERLTHALI